VLVPLITDQDCLPDLVAMDLSPLPSFPDHILVSGHKLLSLAVPPLSTTTSIPTPSSHSINLHFPLHMPLIPTPCMTDGIIATLLVMVFSASLRRKPIMCSYVQPVHMTISMYYQLCHNIYTTVCTENKEEYVCITENSVMLNLWCCRQLSSCLPLCLLGLVA